MEELLEKYNSSKEELERIDKELFFAINFGLQKAGEELEQTIKEFGEHTMNDYEREVIEECKKRVKEQEEKIANLQKNADEIKNNMEHLATDKNITTLTISIRDLDKQIQLKNMDLNKVELELQEFYMKDDQEGKLFQDFYNRKDAIRKEIEELQSKRDQVNEVLETFKKVRDKYLRVVDNKYVEYEKYVELNADSALEQPTVEVTENEVDKAESEAPQTKTSTEEPRISIVSGPKEIEQKEGKVSETGKESSQTKTSTEEPGISIVSGPKEIEQKEGKVPETGKESSQTKTSTEEPRISVVPGSKETEQKEGKVSETGKESSQTKTSTEKPRISVVPGSKETEQKEGKVSETGKESSQTKTSTEKPKINTVPKSKETEQKEGKVSETGKESSQTKTSTEEPKENNYYLIDIGRRAEIRIGGYTCKLGKDVVTSGIRMSDEYLMDKLEENSAITRENKELVREAIKNKVIDSVVVNAILTYGQIDKCEERAKSILKIYCKQCLSKTKDRVGIGYDQKDLSKTNIFANLFKKEVNQSEKFAIMERGRIAERYGFGKLTGEVKYSIASKIMSWIKREPLKRLPSIEEQHEAALAYNAYRDVDKQFLKDIRTKEARYHDLLDKSGNSKLSKDEIEELEKLEIEIADKTDKEVIERRKADDVRNNIQNMNETTHKEYHDLAKSQEKQDNENSL